MLVIAFAENVAAHLAAIQRNQEENQLMIDAVIRYVQVVRTCPSLDGSNTPAARRALARLMGEEDTCR